MTRHYLKVGPWGDSMRPPATHLLSQVLLLAHHHGIDVVDEIQRKWLVWRAVSPRPTDVLPHEA